MTTPRIVNGTPATAWCPNCGDTHTRADGKCARCGAGTMSATTQDGIDSTRYGSNGGNPSPAPKPAAQPGATTAGATPLRLASTSQSRRWMELTLAMIAEAEAEAAVLRARVGVDRKRLDELERIIGGLKSLPQQVALVEGEQPKRQSHLSGNRLGDRWSLKHARCVACGRIDRPHKARGLCSTCYEKKA